MFIVEWEEMGGGGGVEEEEVRVGFEGSNRRKYDCALHYPTVWGTSTSQKMVERIRRG